MRASGINQEFIVAENVGTLKKLPHLNLTLNNKGIWKFCLNFF